MLCDLFILTKSALKNTVMEKQINYYRVHGNDKRNTEHKFDVLGLVARREHAKIHCNATAEEGEKHKRLFGYAKLDLILF